MKLTLPSHYSSSSNRCIQIQFHILSLVFIDFPIPRGVHPLVGVAFLTKPTKIDFILTSVPYMIIQFYTFRMQASYH